MAFDEKDIIWRPTVPPEQLDKVYDQPEHTTRTIEAGWRLTEDHAAFSVETIFEKDCPIPLRDGTKILTDLYRPAAAGKVPALVAWSPYGKSACRKGGLNPLDMIPGRVGVPQSRLSGFEKFEAPDPAEWVGRGYAVINPDTRGTYDSEGDLYHFGNVEARDGYDLIEEIAKAEWCNGKVALVGNSWLGIAQWFIAAERPPHLACIAPLEGASDLYREILCRGGIPQIPFWDFLSSMLRGRNKQEDVIAMLKQYPFVNNYWSDKRAKIRDITVPAYILASYSTFLHTFGSFRGYTEIPHQKKWLRVHPTQEWYDLYQKSTNDDLQRFFDRYTKDVDNDWEATPHVRASLLNFTEKPPTHMSFDDWPVSASKQETLYLTPKSSLTNSAPSEASTFEYDSTASFQQMDQDTEEICFRHTFDQPASILGCARAVLYMSCEEHDDMDVYVQLRKTSKDGKVLQHSNIPTSDGNHQVVSSIDPINPLIYLGPTGCLRASHRAIDNDLSTPWWPEHDYTHKVPVRRGDVVKLEIGLWQTGMRFEAGEGLMMKVAGHNMTLAEFPELRGQMPNFNKGKHRLHVGGDFSSHLIIPRLRDE